MIGPRLGESTLVRGAVVALAAFAAIVASTDFEAPPRYDGAGYSVLARSIAEGKGYREIDHPDEPRHTHFPPLYPLALAIFGRSPALAHAFSVVCTVLAVRLATSWFQKVAPGGRGWWLGAALAFNWTWDRVGGSIQSEPLFLALSMLAVWLFDRFEISPQGLKTGAVVGFVAGLAILTRHVGVCLVAALVVEAIGTRRFRQAIAIAAVSGLVVAPWVVWLATTGRSTQAGLFESSGILQRIGDQTLFYARRLPDLVAGPFVESATVFGRSRIVSLGATLAAIVATCVVILGWTRLARNPATRLAALVPAATLPLLVVWPFTEAGRFLIPLLPFVILGADRGLGGGRRAVALIMLATLPYSAYAIATGRARAQGGTHVDFDAACRWIKTEGSVAGPILTRHPGEAFLATGRKAVGGEGEAEPIVERYGVAYLIVDDERYANAPASPAGAYVRAHPDRVELVRDGPTRVYEVRRRR